MQTSTWANCRLMNGWKHIVLEMAEIPAGKVIVYYKIVPGLGRLYYIPGLSGIDQRNLISLTKELKKLKKAFGVRLELDQPADAQLLAKMQQHGWRVSRKHIQYRHTVAIDLNASLDEIWMSLKSRGRYEVLQAQKAGVKAVQVEPNEENLTKMYNLMQTTSSRNRFYIRDKNFTLNYWRSFRKNDDLELWFAKHDGDLLAGAIVLKSGLKAWYKDGGSVRLKSNLMAARALQWEIISSLNKKGYKEYDLSGIPDPSKHQTSSMHGIYVFKTGYSKETIELIPTLDLPLSPAYKLWPKVEANWLRLYNIFKRSLWY